MSGESSRARRAARRAAAIGQTLKEKVTETPGRVSQLGERLYSMFQEGGAMAPGSTARIRGGQLLIGLLVDAILRGGQNKLGAFLSQNLEGQALDAQAAALNPEATTERMMQPITKAQRDQALMLLMRQLGVKGSSVADGEAWT